MGAWCMPSQMMQPLFYLMAQEYKQTKKKTVWVEIDVDENLAVADKYQVEAYPTFAFIRNKELKDLFHGADAEKLREKVDDYTKVLKGFAAKSITLASLMSW